MTPRTCLDRLLARADPERARGQAAYHKIARRYLGVPNPELDRMAMEWRRALPVSERIGLAAALWESDIFEARVVAAKLLTQARIRPDAGVWELLCRWVPDFDSWAIADHACMAIRRRLVAEPGRLDTVAGWTGSDHMWTRRAALVATLPWARMPHPGADDIARRERILGWAAGYVADRDRFIQKAVAWWLRELSRRAPDRTRAFLDAHGAAMKPFARREAARHLPQSRP